MLLAILGTALFVAGCGPKTLQPFTQSISDTALDFEMVAVPAGTVTIEDENGPREVKVDAFWISPVELTWDMYDVFHLRLDRRRSAEGSEADAVTRPSKPYMPPDRGYGHEGYPAISISFHAATSYCQWLSLKTGRTYRLPTEAEWLLACRLGAIDATRIADFAWYDGNTDFQTRPVATKLPDALGIYDMYGNATEWVTDGNGEPLTLGGSFLEPADQLGPAWRVPTQEKWNESDPQLPKGTWWLADADFIGFRIVCVPD